MNIISCIFSYLVYNLVRAFLGLATMFRGESLSAMVDSQCAEKSVKMCRTCVGCVGLSDSELEGISITILFNICGHIRVFFSFFFRSAFCGRLSPCIAFYPLQRFQETHSHKWVKIGTEMVVRWQNNCQVLI